MEEEGIDKGL
jgi:hypothetical protein